MLPLILLRLLVTATALCRFAHTTVRHTCHEKTLMHITDPLDDPTPGNCESRTKCHAVYKTVGRVSVKLGCDGCASVTKNTNEDCKDCSGSKCNDLTKFAELHTVFGSFKTCPLFDGTKTNSFDTYKRVYCAGTSTQMKCNRIDYKSGSAGSVSERVWLGCAADCGNAKSGKHVDGTNTGEPAFCRECTRADESTADCIATAFTCYQSLTIKTAQDWSSAAASNCATLNKLSCYASYNKGSNKDAVTITAGCGKCPSANCFECSSPSCNTETNLKTRWNSKLIKCPSYNDNKITSGFASSYQHVFCGDSVDTKKCMRIDYKEGVREKVWIGSAAECTSSKIGKKTDGSTPAECKECKYNADCWAMSLFV